MSDIEFFMFAGAAYPYVPSSEERGGSIFVDMPTDYFDPLRGQKVIADYVTTMADAERLGFDGVLTAEQHGGPSATTGQSVVLATWIAARTTRILIGCVGPIINFYANPVRFAEEISTLDQLTGGRAIMGMPMGIGPNWHGTATANPAFARERYREAHELLIKAMTDPGPFEWIGRFYHIPYVNLWPKPLQRPHPPVFIPAVGSKETLELCAKNDYVYQAVLVPRKLLLRNCELFRELRANAGRPSDPKKIAAVLNVHVAETDAQARQECEPYVMWNYQNGLRSSFPDSFPPGHVSVDSLRGMALGGGYRSRDLADLGWDDIVDEGWVVAGSPETVAERIEELMAEMEAGRLIVIPDFFVMPSWLVRKSLEMFAEEVIPRFRKAGGKPVWATRESPGYETMTEYGARVQEPKALPTARMPGMGVVGLRTAHIAELRMPPPD